MKNMLRVVAAVMALGLVPAMAAENAATLRAQQMEKIGALVGRLTLRFTQTLPVQITNAEGEGGAPDYQAIQKLYTKALVAPQNVLNYENNRPAEQRLTSSIDEANAKIRSINEMWTDFTQKEWGELAAKTAQCNSAVTAMNHILSYAVKSTLDQIVLSGVDMAPVIALLEALDKRADEIKAQAETGHIAQWRSVLAKWTAVAKF